MPLVQTRGAASAQGFGEFAQVTAVNYIEDVFSTYVYSGNDSTQTITNNIDISTKGALVWVKGRSGTYGTWDHTLINTPISNTTGYSSNTTGDGFGLGGSAFSPTTTGFNLNTASASLNNNGTNYVSWTFREQPKFFDIVTYTGTGSNTTIAHNLGSVPGCIIVKRTDTTAAWAVYHRSLANTQYLVLNTTAAAATGATWWNSTTPTSAVFSVGTDATVNASAGTYVAYVFAHDSGGFGLTGTDNVISCGSFTADGSGLATVNLGYEPQWILMKPSTTASSGNWIIADIMRGLICDSPGGAPNVQLYANLNNAESGGAPINITSTGFEFNTLNSNWYNQTFIYIAIRRGPMKVPTSGTSVFQPIAYTGNGTSQSITTGITGDLTYIKYRTDGGAGTFWFDRLRNPKAFLDSTSNVAEVTGTQHITAFNQLGFSVGNNGNVNDSGGTFISQTFKRAPIFFDEVCYTGTGSATTFSHNLGAVPELMIAKCRNDSGQWTVYSSSLLASEYLFLNSTAAKATNSAIWNATAPTSSVFSVGTSLNTNSSGFTFVAYLFATCAGVSKVGSYTGTGTTLQIDCGFTGGARFVLIKKTSGTGSWYVWDSARGIVSGNDPYLLLNSTAAEVTNTDYIDTYSAGFEISSTAPSEINENGGSFIFLAIA